MKNKDKEETKRREMITRGGNRGRKGFLILYVPLPSNRVWNSYGIYISPGNQISDDLQLT